MPASVSATVAGSAASLAVDPAVDGNPAAVAASTTQAGVPGNADNATAMARLSDASVASSGTRTASEAWSDVVADVGARKAASADDASSRGAIKTQAQAMNDSSSGVTLDEEMVQLSSYQRAWQAGSRLVQVADSLLQQLFSSG